MTSKEEKCSLQLVTEEIQNLKPDFNKVDGFTNLDLIKYLIRRVSPYDPALDCLISLGSYIITNDELTDKQFALLK